MDYQIGANAFQKRNHQLGGVRTMGCQNEERCPNHKADEHLKVDFLFRGETQVALLGDFSVVVDKTDDSETDESKKRQENEGVCEIGPKQRRHGSGENDQNATHGGRAGFFLVLLWAFFADVLPDLQFADPADQRWAEGKTKKHSLETRVHSPHGDVAKNIERAEVALQGVVKEVVKHFSALPLRRQSHRPPHPP